MKLNDSTRRALRTGYQFVVALAGIVPTFLLALPTDSPLATRMAVVLGFLTLATKFLNSLEDRGVIPAWLKAPASDGANPVPADLPVLEPDPPGVDPILDAPEGAPGA